MVLFTVSAKEWNGCCYSGPSIVPSHTTPCTRFPRATSCARTIRRCPPMYRLVHVQEVFRNRAPAERILCRYTGAADSEGTKAPLSCYVYACRENCSWTYAIRRKALSVSLRLHQASCWREGPYVDEVRDIIRTIAFAGRASASVYILKRT